MKDGRVLNEENSITNRGILDTKITGKVKTASTKALSLLRDLDELLDIAKSDPNIDAGQKDDILTARDYASQCVGRLSLIR